VKAPYLLRSNIDALLKARGQTRHDLAFYCRRTDAWLSKIFTDNPDVQRNGIPLKYLDRISDFFGIATYQLFQPGISSLTERRKAERRLGRDRRVSHLTQQAREALKPTSAHIAEEDIADLIRIRTLSPESRVVVRQSIEALDRSEREAAARKPRPRSADAGTGQEESRAPRGKHRSGER
jgi:transcriptional regulator with XRE-family HTH domain